MKFTKLVSLFTVFMAFGFFSCVSVKDPNIVDTKIVLNSMFKKNMVFQRDKNAPVWGKAQPGKTVKVSFLGREKTAIADKNGYWTVTLDPMAASATPSEMTVDYVLLGKDSLAEAMNFTVMIKNIVIGEVWLCSGQSNMELGMSAIEGKEKELDDSDYPLIRLYSIGKNASPFPLDRISSAWVESERDIAATMGWQGFSAIGFMFGRKIHKELNVPVGIILTAFGGSKIHPWIASDELKTTPVLRRYYNEWEAANKTYEAAVRMDSNASHPFAGILDYNRLKPVTLYNAMIYPVVPFALRGFLWYQGESNVGEDRSYTDQMKALIASWRRVFNQGDIPFYFVQVAPWNYGNDQSLPRLWEAQTAALSVPNTGMAVTVDVGDVKNIHPKRKRQVADRLALIALADAYGKTGIDPSGPVFKDMTISGDAAVISFDHTGAGLVSRDGKPLSWFTIAGSDMRFVPADATIVGNTVSVKSDKVKTPVAVRYAWSGVAEDPNLSNKEGLPAMPFRTDK